MRRPRAALALAWATTMTTRRRGPKTSGDGCAGSVLPCHVPGHGAHGEGRRARFRKRDSRRARHHGRVPAGRYAKCEFAIQLFTQGKEKEFPLEATLRQLRRKLADRPDVLRMFIQIQLQTALWSGSFTPAARTGDGARGRGDLERVGLRGHSDGGAPANAAVVSVNRPRCVPESTRSRRRTKC